MPASQTRVITKLLERRQIEAGLHEMLGAGTDLEFRRQAQRVAGLGPEVIPTIIGNLDGADARLLAAMGVVATFLDRGEVTRALRRAVLASRLTDQGRVGAMTILQRFLGQIPDEQLLEKLDDPQRLILASLEEVLRQATRDPGVLIQYMEALDRQEPDRVLSVMQKLAKAAQQPDPSPSSSADGTRAGLGPERVVALLRMMSQDVRDEIAAAALDALGTLRFPEAGRALQSLLPAVAPHLRPVAERHLRKLQFRGLELGPLPPPDPGWRALASPPGGRGEQSVWFIFQQEGKDEARFLNVLLHDRAGAAEAVGHPQVPASILPPRRRQGHVHDVALPDGSGVILMLEVSFDLGRRLVREALADNRATQIPVASSLRLLGSWLWEVAGADSLPSRRLPDLGREEEVELAGRAASLLAQPAFVGWSLQGELLLGAAKDLFRHPGWDQERFVRRLAGELFASPQVADAFRRRLTAMSEWLLLAGDETCSRLALATARALRSRPADQPFVQALVRRDLNLVLQSLQQYTEQLAGGELSVSSQ